MMTHSTPVQPGLSQPSKELAIKTIRGLLTGPRDVIYFSQDSAQLNERQWRHIYRFFIINSSGLYAISGLITLLFSIKLTDRTQVTSFTQMNAIQDREAFAEALKKQLQLPSLVLEDLFGAAQETIDFVISPNVCEFIDNDEH